MIIARLAARDLLADTDGTVVITANNDQTITSRGNVFLYKVPGVIESFYPSQGQEGTLVTIKGTNLLGYDESLDSVTLAGVDAKILQRANERTHEQTKEQTNDVPEISWCTP